jgi:DNA-binding transcriptional LysR family regulator
MAPGNDAAALDLNLLPVLVALLDAGSVSQAAVTLGVSQPTVSGALAKLRAHFNDPLFVRSARGMAPTPRGTEVVSAARAILREIDETLRPEVTFDPARSHRPFTFALSDVGEIVFLPKLVRRFAEASPETPVRSVSLRPVPLVQALEDGDVDIAVGYFPDLKRNDFFQQRLFTHHFVCLLRHDHPIQGNRLTMGEFLRLRHAVVHSEGRSQEIFESYLKSRGLARHVAVMTPHFLSIPGLIAQSDMVVTVPHAVGVQYGKPEYGLKVIGPPFPSPRIELRQHWHRKFHKDARNVWLRRNVSELFNETTDEW